MKLNQVTQNIIKREKLPMNFKTTTLTICTIGLLITSQAEAKSRISLDSMPPLPGTPVAPPKSLVDLQDYLKSLPEFYGEFNGEKLKTKDIMSEITATLKKQRPGITKAQITQLTKRIASSQIDKLAIMAVARQMDGFKEPTTKQIEAQRETIAKRFGGMANLEKRLKSDGVTPDKLNSILTENMIIENYLNAVKNQITVSDKEITVEYNNNRQRYTHKAEVKASHILLTVPKNASLKKEEEIKEQMNVILQKIKDGGDFAEIAKEKSACPSARNGGDLGFFTAGRMVKPFSDAAFKLKVGEVSGIVRTNFGFHIIKVTDKKEAGVTPLSEVKDQLTAQIKKIKINQFIKGKIQESKEKNKAKLLF